MIDFVITGCGRSSTKWTAEALTAAGLPCAHENFCSSWTDDYDDDGVWHNAPCGVGESSWQAAPFLYDMQWHGVKTVHLIRHPVEVASSLIANEMLLPVDGELKPWHKFAKNWIGDRIWRLHPHDRALQFWTDWNKLIEEPDLRWFVDQAADWQFEDLGRLLGRAIEPQKIDTVPKNVNHWVDVERLERKDFAPQVWDDAMDLWSYYTKGYPIAEAW